MYSSEMGCTPERERKRKSKVFRLAGPFLLAIYTLFHCRYWSVFDLGIKISKCSFSSVIPLALSSINLPTLNKPVKPKGNINVVFSSFDVQEGPAKGLQSLIIVGIEISSLFLIGLENAFFHASKMFVEGVVTAGLLFLCVALEVVSGPI